MSARDEKLSTDFGEAAQLAIEEHLSTLKLGLPAQDVDVVSKQGEVVSVPNPLWIKIKTLKNRAASDVLRIMQAIDPDSMKVRRVDRLETILKRVAAWSGPKEPAGNA